MKTENLNSAAPLNLVILGGGYAGLMALITLKNRSPNAYILIVS
jgi:NADH dehydrogenase FAD-containing subunit